MKANADRPLLRGACSPLALLSSLLLVSGWTAASAGDVTVHGFGTVGAAYLDKPAGWTYARSLNQHVNDDDLRLDLDSVVGVQINYEPSPTFEVVAQAAASRLDGDAEHNDYLELGFVGWHPDSDWSVRLGRVNLDAYLISDHRVVGFTYQFIRPPTEYYSRMPTSLDGGDIARTWVIDGVQWRTKLFVGRTENGPGNTRLTLWPVIGLVGSRESDGLLLRISALHGRTRNDIRALQPLMQGLQQMQGLPVPSVANDAGQMQAALSTRGMQTNYIAGALAYDRHDWLLTAEANRSKVKGMPWISFTSGYVSAGHRFGAISAFVTESVTRRDSAAFRAPDWATPLAAFGPQLAQQAQQLANGAAATINTMAADQSSTSVGMRWDVTSRIALKTQWDHVRWRNEGSALWFNSGGPRGSANVVAVAADFVF